MQQDEGAREPAGSDGKQEIERQFALLQDEMKRVLAGSSSPIPAADSNGALLAGGDAQFKGGKPWQSQVPRGQAADDGATVAELLARTEAVGRRAEEIGRHSEDSAEKIAIALEQNQRAVLELSVRLGALERRRWTRLLWTLAMLLAAAVIGGVVFVNKEGGLDGLLDTVNAGARVMIDHFNAVVFSTRPHAESTPTPPVSLTASAPPPGPRDATPAQPSPAPAQPQVATISPDTSGPQVSAGPAATTPMPVAPMPVTPVPVTPPALATLPSAAPPAPGTSPEQPAATPQPSQSSVATAAQSAPTPAPSLPAPATPAPPLASAAPTSPPLSSPTPADTSPTHTSVILRAKADTWVQVRNKQGGVLIERVLHDGDSWTVPDQPGLVLSTGNAGGLDLLVDGAPIPPLGVSGAIRRDIPLDADLLRTGRPGPEPTVRPKPSATSG